MKPQNTLAFCFGKGDVGEAISYNSVSNVFAEPQMPAHLSSSGSFYKMKIVTRSQRKAIVHLPWIKSPVLMPQNTNWAWLNEG